MTFHFWKISKNVLTFLLTDINQFYLNMAEIMSEKVKIVKLDEYC